MFDPNELRKAADEPEDDPNGLRGCQLAPDRFASATFAQAFPTLFNDYVECRIQGLPRDVAAIEALEMIRLGIDMANAYQLGTAMETNPYVKARFRKSLSEKDAKKDLWTVNKAINHLLRLVEDQDVRDTTRLNAINSLNSLCGYATLDDGLSRRVQQTLRDFDRLNAIYEGGGSPLLN
jgi:hypothetical protein